MIDGSEYRVIPEICVCCRWWLKRKDMPNGQEGYCHYWPIQTKTFATDGCSRWEKDKDAVPQGSECIPKWQIVEDV